MSLTPDLREELRALLLATRSQLEFERACGSSGIQLLPDSRAPRERSAMPGSPASTPTIDSPRFERAQPPERLAPARASEPIAPASSIAIEAIAQPPAAAMPPEERLHRLEVLAREAAACTSCVLHEKRQQSVFARGSATAEVAFVGEGPGRDEDIQGFPFVGAAGKLLDRMVAAMGYSRDEVYICNVVKCRPPENRTPRPEEMLACSRYLVPQLECVGPKYIVALGRCAAQALGVADVTGPWRGRFGAWRGIPVMPTYHPAFLLRSPEFKRVVWEDLQQVMGRLGRQAKRAES
jgi:uracil-DNA glycosylase family 4